MDGHVDLFGSAMEKHQMTKQQAKKVGIVATVIALIITAIICVLVGIPLVKFANQPELFRKWAASYGMWSRVAYVGMVILQVVVAVLPGEPFEIAGGYAFGAVEGTILCLAACTAGSLLVFGLVRRFGVPFVEMFFPPEKLEKVKFLKTTPKRDFIFMLIFMLPGTPKDLLSYFAGLTDMRFSLWLMICSLGRLPALVTSTVGGDALGTKDYWFAVFVFAATMVVSGIGLLIYDRICKRRSREQAPVDGGEGNDDNNKTAE